MRINKTLRLYECAKVSLWRRVGVRAYPLRLRRSKKLFQRRANGWV